MKNRYHVKFIGKGGKTIYGIVDEFSPEAKKVATKGQVIVDDAITPERYIVAESQLIDLPMGDPGRLDMKTGRWTGGGEFHQFVNDAAWEAEQLSKKVKSVAPGAMFSVGVADGSATYVVVSVTGKKCKVEWRGFCADRWVDHHFGYGGIFPVSEIARYMS
jgi:hypothetical protein